MAESHGHIVTARTSGIQRRGHYSEYNAYLSTYKSTKAFLTNKNSLDEILSKISLFRATIEISYVVSIGGISELDINLAILFIAGIIAASLGSLVGAGGGFLLIPLLLFLLPPDTNAGIIGGMSLSLALTNGLISSVGYRKQRRIHFKWGLIFASGSITGAILGASAVQFISRDIYQIIFGTLLILLTIYLLLRPAPQTGSSTMTATEGAPPPRIIPGVALGLPIGFIAGLVGIGGGIVLVPAIVYAFRFAPHIATATSVFTIIFTSLAAIAVRTVTLNLEAHLIGIIVVVAGALIGGRIGPVLSQKISGQWLMRVLAVALGVTGASLTMRGLGIIAM